MNDIALHGHGSRCDWPCSPQRTLRGYEALTKGMKSKNPNIKAPIRMEHRAQMDGVEGKIPFNPIQIDNF